MYEFTGTVKKIMDTKQVSDTFTVREFVVENPDDRYPQPISFQVVQDKVSLLDSVKEGDKVTVSFDLRGREWEGRYFVNLNAWRITAGDSQGTAPAAASSQASGSDAVMEFEPASDDDDNLPF